MPLAKFVTIDIGSISAGATAERSWESDGDYQLKRIFIVEKGGATLNRVEVTVRKDGEMFTRDYVPAILISHLNNLNPEINAALAKGQKIVFGIKNNEAAARDLYAVLELWV